MVGKEKPKDQSEEGVVRKGKVMITNKNGLEGWIQNLRNFRNLIGQNGDNGVCE
jgi:hypothetical protein